MKKLYKIEQGRKIWGVCGGFAEYFGIDPTIVRIIWGICACLWGVGILAYIVCAIAMPNKSEVVGNNGEYTVNSTEKNEENDNNNENKN